MSLLISDMYPFVSFCQPMNKNLHQIPKLSITNLNVLKACTHCIIIYLIYKMCIYTISIIFLFVVGMTVIISDQNITIPMIFFTIFTLGIIIPIIIYTSLFFIFKSGFYIFNLGKLIFKLGIQTDEHQEHIKLF